jgi:putative sterol carrier protein
MAETVREFFEEVPARITPERARALEGAYRFDVDGAGSWRLEPAGDTVTVAESHAAADCVIRTDEATFLRLVNGQQSPMGAYMTGKVKVEGALGLALKLRDVFGS